MLNTNVKYRYSMNNKDSRVIWSDGYKSTISYRFYTLYSVVSLSHSHLKWN